MKENENGCERNTKEYFPKNCLGELSTVHLGGGPMNVSENYPTIRLGGLSNRFYPNSVVRFREQKPFVLKTMFFLHLA